jgi:hypothetical protein
MSRMSQQYPDNFHSSIPGGTPRSTGYARCDPQKEPAVKPPKRLGSLSEAEQQAQHAVLVQRLIDQRKKQDALDKSEHQIGVTDPRKEG